MLLNLCNLQMSCAKYYCFKKNIKPCTSTAEDPTTLLLPLQVVPVTAYKETTWSLSTACFAWPFSCPGGSLPYAGVGTYWARGPKNAACFHTPEHTLWSG